MRKSSMFARSSAAALAGCSFLLTSLALAPVETARADAVVRGANPVTDPGGEPGQSCPVASPGGPYCGLVGVPIGFDGTRSSDPDGEPLTFTWDFDTSDGIGEDALGPTPVHTYASPGRYAVLLVVSAGDSGESISSSSATTTADIGAACPAIIVNGSGSIRIGSGGDDWSASIQPASDCYTNADVILSSFVLKYAGREVRAIAVKSVVGDKDGDGIEEIRARFSASDLKALFTGTRQGHRSRRVRLTIEARLVNGGVLQGSTQVDLTHHDSGTRATVSPNPFNPSTTLTFTTARAGGAKVDLFDIAGRRVRTLLDDRSLAPGVHEVRIDGRGEAGEALPSGIYFIRGVSTEGEFAKAITLLK